MSARTVTLTWHRFRKLTAARQRFARNPCVYVQTDREGDPLRIGKASKGLEARYRGGTGYALDAAMHHSNNLVFVATVSAGDCSAVESELIWLERERVVYNNIGKRKAPQPRVRLRHRGEDQPRFSVV